MASGSEDERRQAIFATVMAIPPGRVCSYGEVARLSQQPGLARFVGRILGEVDGLPWFRVVRAGGQIAFAQETQKYHEQVSRLVAEGVEIKNGRVQDWKQRYWQGY
ncbi:MGMT family protein [Allohahella marinimesophila]|uniref:DNA base-flipping protein n=1 Tax=Allohahella marinimesophila TaxID=1054972 RepID=A0ABP7NJM6_9GAMM